MFDRLEAFLDGHAPSDADRFDEIIIDEGRIFARLGRQPAALPAPRRPRLVAGRPPAKPLRAPGGGLPGWVTLRSDTNYRSPRDILATLRLLLPLAESVEAGSPLSGPEVDILTYTSPDELVSRR
jgi:hypothetical protein